MPLHALSTMTQVAMKDRRMFCLMPRLYDHVLAKKKARPKARRFSLPLGDSRLLASQ